MVTRNTFTNNAIPCLESIYDNYYTDCANCKEFTDEIYIVVLAPSKATGKMSDGKFQR